MTLSLSTVLGAFNAGERPNVSSSCLREKPIDTPLVYTSLAPDEEASARKTFPFADSYLTPVPSVTKPADAIFGRTATVVTLDGQSKQARVQLPSRSSSPKEWFYLDPRGRQRGPFDEVVMRQWFHQGHFKETLNVRCDGMNEYFVPLSEWFAAGHPAFLSQVPQRDALKKAATDAIFGDMPETKAPVEKEAPVVKEAPDKLPPMPAVWSSAAPWQQAVPHGGQPHGAHVPSGHPHGLPHGHGGAAHGVHVQGGHGMHGAHMQQPMYPPSMPMGAHYWSPYQQQHMPPMQRHPGGHADMWGMPHHMQQHPGMHPSMTGMQGGMSTGMPVHSGHMMPPMHAAPSDTLNSGGTLNDRALNEGDKAPWQAPPSTDTTTPTTVGSGNTDTVGVQEVPTALDDDAATESTVDDTATVATTTSTTSSSVTADDATAATAAQSARKPSEQPTGKIAGVQLSDALEASEKKRRNRRGRRKKKQQQTAAQGVAIMRAPTHESMRDSVAKDMQKLREAEAAQQARLEAERRAVIEADREAAREVEAANQRVRAGRVATNDSGSGVAPFSPVRTQRQLQQQPQAPSSAMRAISNTRRMQKASSWVTEAPKPVRLDDVFAQQKEQDEKQRAARAAQKAAQKPLGWGARPAVVATPMPLRSSLNNTATASTAPAKKATTARSTWGGSAASALRASAKPAVPVASAATVTRSASASGNTRKRGTPRSISASLPVQSAVQPTSLATVQSAPRKKQQAASGGSKAKERVIAGDFADWCRKQLRSLTGSGDLHLAEFLLALDDGMVRQTCFDQFGDTTKCENFVNDFLVRRALEFGGGNSDRRRRR